MYQGEAAFTQIGQRLVQAVLARFQQAGMPMPAIAGMVPAPIVWDACQCGQLAVAVPRIYPSAGPPLEGAQGGGGPTGAATPVEAMPWPPFLVGEFQVVMLRCATTDAQPATRVLQAEAAQGQQDAYWTLVAVACELWAMLQDDEIEHYQLADQPFLPAQGGCQGGMLNALVTIPLVCPCP